MAKCLEKCLVNTAKQLTETKYFENSYKVKAATEPVTHHQWLPLRSKTKTKPLGKFKNNSNKWLKQLFHTIDAGRLRTGYAN